mgnify:CR=1 FL=1
MIIFSKEQIKHLHRKLIQETGGIDGIRDERLLESAVAAPFQSFGGEELYPSVPRKAARLCYGLIRNHVFLDGNKRIGIYALLAFLEMNGIEVGCSDEELVALGLGIAEDKFEHEDIVRWIVEHSK